MIKNANVGCTLRLPNELLVKMLLHTKIFLLIAHFLPDLQNPHFLWQFGAFLKIKYLSKCSK